MYRCLITSVHCVGQPQNRINEILLIYYHDNTWKAVIDHSDGKMTYEAEELGKFTFIKEFLCILILMASFFSVYSVGFN